MSSQVMENTNNNMLYYCTVLYGTVQYIQYIPQATHNNITLITKRTREVNSHNGPFTKKNFTQDRYHGTRTRERTSLSYVNDALHSREFRYLLYVTFVLTKRA